MVCKKIYTKRQGQNEQKFVCGTVLLLVSMLLTVATCAQASPTTADINICSFDRCSFSKAENTTDLLETHDAAWVGIGRDILRPHVVVISSGDHQQGCICSLPAVPASILMVVFGFACISLVRDRKIWLAALAGILWAGYAGVYVVSPLVLRFRPRACTVHYFTEVAGRFSLSDTVTQTRNNFIIPQFAMIRLLPYLIRAIFRLIPSSVWFICPAAAFIPHVLPRGPPVTA